MFFVNTPTGRTKEYETRTEATQMATSISQSRPGVEIQVVAYSQINKEEDPNSWALGLWKEEIVETIFTEGNYNICGN